MKRRVLIEKTNKPKNLKEAIDILTDFLSWEEDIKFLKENDEKTILANMHHSLGRQIRNEWGLWQPDSEIYQWFKERGIFHADDMSSIVIISFVRILKKQPINLKEQLKKHKDFWENNQ